MELIIGLIALFFGFRLIGLFFHVLFALIGLLFRLWLFSLVGLMFVLFIVGVLGSGNNDRRSEKSAVQPQQTYQEPPKVVAEPVSSEGIPYWGWACIGTGVVAIVVGGSLWLQVRKRRNERRQPANKAPQAGTSRSGVDRIPPALRFSNPATEAVKFQQKKYKEIELLKLTAADIEAMAKFRKRWSWVMIDVPPKFFEPFLRECAWLKEKTKKDASQKDQADVLRDVSVGWTWSRDTI
jgi:hypothetical protein